MSNPSKGKSIWKRHEKPRGEARVENEGKMYYRINRKTSRIETNLLEWERMSRYSSIPPDSPTSYDSE